MNISYEVSCFWAPASRAINTARLKHFNSLNLDIKDKSILETGSGGCGDLTLNLLKHTNDITLNDTRQSNINFVKKRIKIDLPSNNWDLNEPLPQNKKFDVVYSYGTIYHLNNPVEAIKNLSKLCNDFFIISLAGNGANSEMYLKYEKGNDQSTTSIGCRCGRNWIKNELKKYFKYVYFPISQPDHPDFHKDWSGTLPIPTTRNVRFVIIGSHKKLNNPNLITKTPNVYN